MKPSKFFYIILFFILIILAHPFYMKQSVYDWIYKSCYGNNKTQIEICANNPVEISQKIKKIKDSNIEHYINSKNSENCTIIKLPISNKWENYNIPFKTIDDVVNIHLEGPEEWENGRIPILIDYRNLVINGKSTDMSQKSLWYNYPYTTQINNTQNNKLNEFSVSIRRHHLNFKDFKLIYKTYSGWKISSFWFLLGTFLVITFSLLLLYQKKYKHLFCFLVFLFLIIPTIYLSKENLSKQENRSFSKLPSLFIDKKINENFGIEFDKWLSDRFGGRKIFIDTRFLILYRINNKIANERAFIADDDWKFPAKGIKNISSIESQQQTNIKIISSLKKIGNSTKGKDIQIYVILEPSRSMLYKKYWEKYYPYIPYYDYISELKKELKNYPDIHFIDLNDTFEENKDSIRLYDKNDPHMTLSAVNIMIEKVVSELGSDIENPYKKLISYKDKDCKLYDNINFFDYILKIKTINKKETCKEIIIKDKKAKYTKIENGIREASNPEPYVNKDLFLILPCYEEFMFPILSELYSHTISVNYNTFDEHDEEKLKKDAISKLKSIKSGTDVIIFLSHPTEFNISKSNEYLEAY